MNEKKIVTLSPSIELSEAIYATLAEWSEPMQSLIEREGGDIRSFLADPKKLQEFMRVSMLRYWSDLTANRKQDLRHTLQYLLNLDEFLPYVSTGKDDPQLAEKKGSWAQRIRDSCQGAMTPPDGYALCQVMWKILFDDEDWHADIGAWVVNNAPKLTGLPELSVDVPARKSWWRVW